jgi:hypothetical protein
MSTAPIDAVLAGLSKVRQRQSGQWSACCPAHDDSGPSLTVRETPDGAVLLHCFAGCHVTVVVASLGLEMSDLFPPRHLTGHEPKRTARLLTAGQALELLDRESRFVAVAAANILHGVLLNENDLSRITQAAGRIHWLLEESSWQGGAHA